MTVLANIAASSIIVLLCCFGIACLLEAIAELRPPPRSQRIRAALQNAAIVESDRVEVEDPEDPESPPPYSTVVTELAVASGIFDPARKAVPPSDPAREAVPPSDLAREAVPPSPR